MATGTRSGQFHNDGESSKQKKHSIKGKTKDSSDMRSTGETPSYRRSERLVCQTPSSSAEKRTSNSLRRSERIEKTGVSSSSGSKKSSTSSSSLVNKKKKQEKSDKIKGAKEQSQDNEVDTSRGLSKKRKRLDARSYRLFLRPQTRTTRSSAARELFKEDNRSQEDAAFSGSSVPDKVREGGDDSGQVKEIEMQDSDEACKEFVDGSSSVFRGLSGFINGNDGQRKKHKVDSVASKSKDSSNSPASKCSDSSSHSSPPALTGKENGSDAVEKEIDGKESGCHFDASRCGHPAANLDYDISVEVLDKEMSNREASITHDTSCSSGTKSKKTEGNASCDKLQSQVLDSERARVGEGASNAEEHLSSRETLVAIETDAGHNACVVCKKPGMLLCCDGKGCKRSYHLTCLDPPLKDIPLGAWLCLFCVIKKIELGVYSVSEGIESVLDIKEGEQHGKHCLVKYKGLAHVHNRWVPESQMVLEAPMLLAKYNRRRQNDKVVRSKQEWTDPHRLLQKRLLMPLKMADDYISRHNNNSSRCCYEWLVKWRGLGYEHATWEFENSQFLTSADAILLIKDYEKRHEEAKKLSDPSKVEEALQVKNNPFHRLLTFPEGFPPGLSNDQLNSINRLREFWHDSHNAVCIDDQERIVKSILFILALQSHTCRPFLVISTITSLPVWEAEIARLAPSVNAVVYIGNKNVRKIIRDVEFYEEGGCIMFQVLLSHPDVVVEDLEALNCIGWEAMLVDECQNSRVSKHFEKFKNLSADFRLLLLCGQLKDNLAEYLNLLTLLDSGEREKCAHNTNLDPKDTLGALTIVKERLAHFLLYERKPDSKFLEYWVPVQISNVQLEQYCATLLSNSTVLHSCSKVDQVGALREILISTRQCCDHPYIVDPLLQSSLTKNLPASEYLDIGVNASGKLSLLDKFLQEIKSRELRVLILFQSIGGAGRNSIGDILDDFLRQRFGPDSYERVDSGLVTSKKLAALNMFNDRARGRFVFLIENRACLPSIKLSSVDAVIIFDSDWNLLNDLRALQRISIESRFDQVKVFRFYSSFTLEEKVLVFARQDTILDSNIQSITPSVSHSLLSWGASYLFSKLDEFHKQDILSNCSETSIDKILLNDLLSELVSQLPSNIEGSCSNNCSLLVKARQSGASYLRSTILFGEKERIASFDKDLPGSWSNLLKGRNPRWRYISQLSQRIRRKVQNFDELSKLPEAENDEGKKKRRKVAIDSIDPFCQQTRIQDKTKEVSTAKVTVTTDNLPPHGSSQSFNISRRNKSVILSSIGNEHESFRDQANITHGVPHSAGVAADDASGPHNSCMVDSEGMGKLDVSKRAHQKTLLKAELSKLCETLRLPGGVRSVAEMFLEHVMKEHLFSQEPDSMLQAFTLSLCCRAASFLNHKVDKKILLELARKHLNFVCNEEQVYSAYSRLSILDRKFSCPKDPSNDENVQSSPEYRSLISSKDVPTEPVVFETPVPTPAAESGHQLPEGDKMTEDSNGMCSVGELTEVRHEAILKTAGVHPNIESLKDVLLKKRIDLIEKIYSIREEDIIEMQKIEMSDFNMQRKDEKRKLMKAYASDLECCRSVYFDSTIRTNKIKRLNQEFSKKMAAFDDHMKFQRRKLALMQVDARNKERQMKDRLLEEAQSTRRLEFDDNLPLSSSGFTMEGFVASEPHEAYGGSENNMFISGTSEILVNAINTMVDNIPVVCRQDRACDGSGNRVLIPVGNGTPPSGFNDVNEVEFVGSAETSTGIQATVPTEAAHDVTVEAQSPATSHGVAGETPTGGLGDKISESEIPPSRCDNTREVTAVESSETSLENLAINSNSGTSTIDDIGKNGNADIPDGACLRTSLNEHAEHSSLAIASVSNGVDCSIPSHQVPSVSEQERLNVSSSEGNNHCFYSSQQTEIPELSPVNIVDSQVEQVRHIEDDSDSLHLQFPPYTDVPLVEHTADSAQRPITSKKEACQQRHCSSQQIEAVMQQQVADASVHNELSDQLVSHSNVQPLGPSTTTLERTHIEDLRSSSYQTHCSTQPTEVLTQQPIVDKVLQVEQSNQLVDQSDAHQLPSATTAERLCCDDHLVTSHRTSSSTQETEVFRQPAAASVQVGVSNQLVNQSFVQPLPPSLSAPTERRRSEDLNSNIQSESGNRRIQLFPMTNLLPSHLLHLDPLQNELVRIWNQKDACNKRHEDKKLQLKLEYDLEMEKVRKKYETLFQDIETECLDEKKLLDTIYKKVLMNCILAEQFRAKFIENRGASASGKGSRSSYAQQPPQVSQPQVLQRPASAPTTSLLNPATMFPTSTPAPPAPPPPIASARLHSQVAATSSQVARQTSAAVFSSNPVRHLSSFFPSCANLQVGIEPRAPAPHLHRFRPHASLSAQKQPVQTGALTSQQQPRASLGSPSAMVPQVAPFPPIHSSMASVGSEVLPVCRGNFVSPIDLPPDAWGSHTGADLPKQAPLTEVMVVAGRLLSTDDEMLPSADASRPTSAAVVCISDDESN